ncbi:hypothetical protein [Vibrio sp. 99-70-13A1]|uniref:hypothetical protein n=1 Tax=Vibrio sp. 99-70-13A1 TaxID=2607601 RepID=UPI001493B129|nr:hypothetical protein [Vibrio sp. 99-70-13A1]NOH96287.1 hypothetical protein [Vibrio sp. 99-70-13A1]
MNSIDTAYNFYSRHIYDEEKIALLVKHNFKVAGSVQSVLWELFGALLVERSGAGTTGADLDGWEVKSAKQGGSYEYQYHLNTGVEKLKEDCIVNHLFCSYSDTYENVTVRVIPGHILAPRYFNVWEPLYFQNYDASVPAEQRRQRFRKNIPYGFVNATGTLILEIQNGKLVFRDDAIISNLIKN